VGSQDMVSREGRVSEVELNGMVIERVKGGWTPIGMKVWLASCFTGRKSLQLQ
jgi:hypothetical protein